MLLAFVRSARRQELGQNSSRFNHSPRSHRKFVHLIPFGIFNLLPHCHGRCPLCTCMKGHLFTSSIVCTCVSTDDPRLQSSRAMSPCYHPVVSKREIKGVSSYTTSRPLDCLMVRLLAYYTIMITSSTLHSGHSSTPGGSDNESYDLHCRVKNKLTFSSSTNVSPTLSSSEIAFSRKGIDLAALCTSTHPN